MRVFDLFSGIGGLTLGLERAGMHTVGFCEAEPACRFWLEEHWPGLPVWKDVRELTGEAVRDRCGSVDLVAGGFPCQDISVAGKGEGIGGSRSGLWAEMFRLVREVRPRWVLVENVPALRTRGADRVLGDLEGEGYSCWPLVVGADDVGAPHRRKRVFIVAHAARDGQRGESSTERADRERARATGDTSLAHRDRLREPQPSGSEPYIGRWPSDGGVERGERPVGCRPELDHATGPRRAGRLGETAGARGLSEGALQPGGRRARWPARPGEPQHEWEAPRLAYDYARLRNRHGTEAPRAVESELGGSVDGIRWAVVGYEPAHRRAALKALGNAVVPQVAEAIGRAILMTEQ